MTQTRRDTGAAPLAGVRIIHIGRYWRKENDVVINSMHGLRQCGAQVTEIDVDEDPALLESDEAYGPWGRLRRINIDVFQPTLEAIEPHLIFCNAGGLYFGPSVAADLRERHRLLGSALSDPEVFHATRLIARTFDLFLTNDGDCLSGYRAAGANAALYPYATNHEYYRPVVPQDELRCDVLVMGRLHSNRLEPVKALVANFDTHVYGENWDRHGIESRGLIYGPESLRAIASAGVCVLFLETPTGATIFKRSVLDFIAAGGLVATNRLPIVRRYLEFDREVIGFRTTEDLVRQVRHYLADRDAARAIRIRGRRRVLRDHTWRTKWPTTIASVLSEKSDA